jgi:hypothetical protein
MDILIAAGAVVTLLGLAGLVWCIARVARARRAGLDDAGLRAEMQKIVALNMAALLVSVFGLMLVVFGVLVG